MKWRAPAGDGGIDGRRAVPLDVAIRAWSGAMCLLFALIPAPGRAQDSGSGVDLHFGNAIHPDGSHWLQGCDPQGNSWLTGTLRRTPTGFLYLCAPDRAELSQWGPWLYRGSLPVGAIHSRGDEENANWLRYVGWEDDLAIGPFSLELFRPEDGAFIDLRGARLTADSQYFKLRAGRAGAFSIDAFYRQMPNVLSANAHSIWNGIGTPHLTLAGGLTPAGSTPAEVAAVSQAAPERRLEVQRDKLGFGLNYYFSREWTGYVIGTQDEARGARPFGGPFFFNFPFADNGGILEIPRPIDDTTTNVSGGLRFAGQAWRMEFAYSGSFYRNDISSYDYETPYALTPVVPGATTPALALGEFASEPDNDHHNVRVNVTRKIPWNGELSLTAALGEMSQDGRLPAPMNCTGQFGIDTGAPDNTFLFDCADWNTTAALSRQRADLEIDTTLLAARIVLQPTGRLTWRGDLRFDRQDYRGDYFAFNPLTGQYGYIAENGAQGSVVPFEMGVWDATLFPSVKTRIRNLPLDKDRLEASVGADLRLSRTDTIGATLGYARTDRDNREVDSVEDTSLRLTWVNRRLERVTFRANYEFIHRSGDPYRFDPYEFTFSTSLPGFVEPEGGVPAHTVDALRKLDVADRDQHKADVMATFAVRDDMTLSATVRGERNHYDAVIGREDYDTFGATLQWEWQPVPETALSAWYGYDRSSLDLANVNDVALTPDPSLGGATYPLDARWWAEDDQRNHYLGATLDQLFGRIRMQLGTSFVDARGTTDYRHASEAALAWPDTAGLAGSGFPAMEHRVASLWLALHVPLTDRLALQVFDRYERGHLFDWHYSGFGTQRVYDHRVYLDEGPESYSSNLIGILFEVKL